MKTPFSYFSARVIARGIVAAGLLLLPACVSAGQTYTDAPIEMVAMKPGKGQLLIYRPSDEGGKKAESALRPVVDPYGLFLAPKIMLDGAELGGRCKLDGVHVINLSPGRYTLGLGKDNEPTITVTVTAGRTSYVKCPSRLGLVDVRFVWQDVAAPDARRELRTGKIEGVYDLD